jgi:spore maturation protein CgeB
VTDIVLIGAYVGYNLESYAKMEFEKLGYSVSFFEFDHLMGSHPNLVRMAITRSAGLRFLSRPLYLNKINEQIKAEVKKEKPKFLFVVNGEVLLPSTLDWIRNQTDIKTALWYPDEPLFYEAFNKHLAPHYDHVFTASPRVIPRYKKIGVKSVHFVTFGCNPSIHRKMELTKEEKKRYEHDISFVGTCYPRRYNLIRKLEKFDISVYGRYWRNVRRKSIYHNGVWGPEFAKVFNASKIVLDIYNKRAREYEINVRTFEATGCGSFTLTEHGYGLDELFKIGKEVVCYNDEVELKELIEYYLDNDEERKEIAAKGQERAYKDHTYEQRIKFMLQKMSR